MADISIIVPAFNEESAVFPLAETIVRVMDSVNAPYELIFVDDGSTDTTYTRLQELSKLYQAIRVIRFNINQGQGKALEEGFRRAKGKIIITMDGDLQDAPVDIPRFIQEINNGYDLVCGWRHDRHDSAAKKIKSRIGNFLQRLITRVKLHDMSCTFRAYRSQITQGIVFSDWYAFCLLPYILLKKNREIKIAEVKITHHPRESGVSKYRFLHVLYGTIFAYLRLLAGRGNTQLSS
jgi:glycosyltransferase involved in cell wall biosynthesis